MEDGTPYCVGIDADGCGPLLRRNQSAARPLRHQVFDYVRSRGRAARADITRALDISAGSATTLTADLIAAGMLREVQTPPRDQGRGRPPVALEVVPEASYVIGLKLAFDKHTAVLADFAGNVVSEATFAASDSRRPQAQLISEINALIDRVLDAGSKSLSDVGAIGVGLPGIIDHTLGRVAWSSILQELDTDLGAALEAHLKMPVMLDNDANMLTLAELWFGRGRDMADFAVVTIESGVGMGLVLDNQLYRGAHGMGLELGHTKVQLDGALCRCGQRGCLEAYLADYALTREAATALDHPLAMNSTPAEIMEALFKEAKAGHAGAQAIFKRAGRYLSLGLSNVIQLFDPAQIILSGERMRYDYLYAETVLAEMQKMTLNEGRKPCKVAIHSWGDMVWARGATALALTCLTDQMLSNEST